MVSTKGFRLLSGGTYRVSGTAEKATVKNSCNMIIYQNSKLDLQDGILMETQMSLKGVED